MKGSTPTTSWTLVIEAAATQAEGSQKALARFCEQYWSPVYAFFRRRGLEVEDARDLTQGFFVRLIEKNYLQDADPSRGRFRTFLFTCARNYSLNEWDREAAVKRGGSVHHVSMDLATAEEHYRAAPVAQLTPAQAFDRRWALTLIERALTSLCAEYEGSRAPLYQALVPHLLPMARSPTENWATSWG